MSSGGLRLLFVYLKDGTCSRIIPCFRHRVFGQEIPALLVVLGAVVVVAVAVVVAAAAQGMLQQQPWVAEKML